MKAPRLSSWQGRYPVTQRERQQLYAKCGPACFGGTDPDHLTFPICQIRSQKGGALRISCKIDPAGCQAAKARATLNGDTRRLKSVRKKCRSLLAAVKRSR